ncbi:sialidase domain-containing protein, partial [Streptococcus pneumoniae]|uniref:sialidase domain-containing protein n=1 Tax=Streptococcus pneumoniae TaxID=1313 RepID=UPI003D67FF1E
REDIDCVIVASPSYLHREPSSEKGLQALFGISNSKPGQQNSYVDVFLRDNGELGMEARDTSSNKNNLVSRPASVWGKYKQEA